MREIIAEQAAKAHASDPPAFVHYTALAWLAAVALAVLAIVVAVDRALERRR